MRETEMIEMMTSVSSFSQSNYYVTASSGAKLTATRHKLGSMQGTYSTVGRVSPNRKI